MDIRLCFLVSLASAISYSAASEADVEASSFLIEGKIIPPDPRPKDWFWTTRISLDGGKRSAFLKVNYLRIGLGSDSCNKYSLMVRKTVPSPLRDSHRVLTCWRSLIQTFITSLLE